MKKLFPILLIIFIIIIFFYPFLFKHLLPIPSDTIVGLYHPFRDFYAKDYPRGIPYKNFLITDPVRQQYPWRSLAISLEKKVQLPLWNPYSFSGSPLLANLQSAVFYPLNILLFIFPMPIGWSILIFLQAILASIFLYLYLKKIDIAPLAAIIGGITFAFSGFSVAWMEWNTIIQTALWLALILLSIEEIFSHKQNLLWYLLFTLSLIFSFFAGHLQTFFYLFIVSFIYLIYKTIQNVKVHRYLPVRFIICYVLFIFITTIQWLPAFQFINVSARDTDQSIWQNPGWFIPWQNLIQFIAPDFFGNPATLNYRGIWNYAEFVGYIGMFPLIMAIFAMFFRRDKKTFFFGSLFFLSFIFALPTPFAKIPFLLKIPFISTSQPTRLLFIIDFSLAVLAALGFDYFLKNKKGVWFPILFIGISLAFLWSYVFYAHISVAKQNLIFPTLLFIISILISLSFIILRGKKHFATLLYAAIVVFIVFDLLRFAQKFTPFINSQYLFPDTQVINFLQKNIGISRVMTTDSKILPPNFSIMYHLQSVDGYDPLYLRRYAEIIAASERERPNINPPFGFNRIITPHNYKSKIMDLLGVKYVLSLSDLHSSRLQKVFQEGDTQIYENTGFLPRAFFVHTIHSVYTKEKAINLLFQTDFDLYNNAIIEIREENVISNLSVGTAVIKDYEGSKIFIETKNAGDGFLLLSDVYYPTWHASVDGQETKIYQTDYTLRGVFVPKGRHIVIFYDTLFL